VSAFARGDVASGILAATNAAFTVAGIVAGVLTSFGVIFPSTLATTAVAATAATAATAAATAATAAAAGTAAGGSLAAMGSAMSSIAVAFTNPATAVFGVLAMAAVLVSALIMFLKPKPLTGEEIVCTNLNAQGLTSWEKQQACFPADALIQTGSGAMLRMSQLTLGTPIATVDAAGKMSSAAVHFFGHKDATKLSLFVHLATSTGHDISLSAEHLIPVASSPSASWSDRTFKRARTVQLGECLWVKANGSLVLSPVVSVSQHAAWGLYNPYSAHGVAIVNNVVASEHSEWFLDFMISDANAHYLPALYAPLIQHSLSTVYQVCPALIEGLSRCMETDNAAPALCVLKQSASWIIAAVSAMSICAPDMMNPSVAGHVL